MAQEPVLIYDSECKFCASSVEFGKSKMGAFPNAIPAQSVKPEQFGLSNKDLKAKIWLLSSGSQKPLGGHLAVAQILLAQRNPLLKFLGFLAKTPPTSWVASGLYVLMARIRHLL